MPHDKAGRTSTVLLCSSKSRNGITDNSCQSKISEVRHCDSWHIETTCETTSEAPVINGIEFHPYLQRAHDFNSWMRDKGSDVSPFNWSCSYDSWKTEPLGEPLVKSVEAHGVTPAVVLLRWELNQNLLAITTTFKPNRKDEYARQSMLRSPPRNRRRPHKWA